MSGDIWTRAARLRRIPVLIALSLGGGLATISLTACSDDKKTRRDRSKDDDEDDDRKRRTRKSAEASATGRAVASYEDRGEGDEKSDDRGYDEGYDGSYDEGYDGSYDEPVPEVAVDTSGVMELDLRPRMPAWVIAAGAYKVEGSGASARTQAIAQAEMLQRSGFEGHIMYVPDYPETTSGKNYYVAYVGPWPYSMGEAYVRSRLREVQRVVPDAYGLKIDDHGGRETVR